MLVQLGDSLLQLVVGKNDGLAVLIVDGLAWVLTGLASLVLVDQLPQYIL